jgi:hypothetical protein
MKFKLNIPLKKTVSKLKLLKQNKVLVLASITPLLLFFLFILAFNFHFRNKIFPRIRVVDINTANKTLAQAEDLLKEEIISPEKIILTAENQKFEIPLQEVDFSYDFSKTASLAYSFYRSGNSLQNVTQNPKSLYQDKNLDLSIKIDYDKLNERLLAISEQISKEPIYPSVSLEKGKAVVNKGQAGEQVDINSLQNLIIQNLTQASNSPISIPLITINPTLSDEEADKLQKRADNLLGKNLT